MADFKQLRTDVKDLIDFQDKSEILIGRLGQLQFRKLQIEKEEDYLKQQYDQIVASEIEISSKLKTNPPAAIPTIILEYTSNE